MKIRTNHYICLVSGFMWYYVHPDTEYRYASKTCEIYSGLDIAVSGLTCR